jgi:pentatricopeptide repeat protein
MGTEVSSSLQRQDFHSAFTSLKEMVQMLKFEKEPHRRQRLSRALDACFQRVAFASFACAQNRQQLSSSNWSRVRLGEAAINLQLSAESALNYPYNLVPKRTFLQALKALATLEAKNDESQDSNDEKFWLNSSGRGTLALSPAGAAFRILQRLITGIGVRTHQSKAFIMEHDFSLVMNAYVNDGRMDMADRVAALQERTPHAPPLSAVAYSILLKGHGRRGDAERVRRIVRKAEMNNVRPDTVMMNSLLDAYVSCKAMNDARNVFQSMTIARSTDSPHFTWFPRPTSRTYNIYLKGLANEGLWEEALRLSENMKASRLWDPVTTNTLVHAAVVKADYDRAEAILAEHTIPAVPGQTDHLNVEAYTELIDAYAKNSRLQNAIALFQTMRQRGVELNEITFTCLIAGFGRSKQVDQARKMIAYMPKVGIQPTCATYSALITALLSCTNVQDAENDPRKLVHVCDADVDNAVRVLSDMIHANVRPRPATVSIIVRALGQCSPSRVREATLLVTNLERDNIIPRGNVKVMTALMQVRGVAGDAIGCVEAFRAIHKMDLAAVNSFLDACCRCGRYRLAFDTFDYYFRRETSREAKRNLTPDVISYSILVSASLKHANADSIRRAQSFYDEMKSKYSTMPDNTMVDTILKSFVRLGRTRTLTKEESLFAVRVLRDAANLSWNKGQLERRKRAVGALVGTNVRGLLLLRDENEDDLFKRKGWNKVDSSFRIWGPSLENAGEPQSKKVVDRFLESKGWNDVDSGFRIL